jgi:hypothetical protein
MTYDRSGHVACAASVALGSGGLDTLHQVELLARVDLVPRPRPLGDVLGRVVALDAMRVLLARSGENAADFLGRAKARPSEDFLADRLGNAERRHGSRLSVGVPGG